MDNSPRARVRKVANAMTAVRMPVEPAAEGRTRGLERPRKDSLPPPVSRPNHVSSGYSTSTYVHVSATHGIQHQGSSWYNQNNTPYLPHASPPAHQQQYQQHAGYGPYFPPQQEGSPHQPDGYYGQQNPVNSPYSAGSWNAPPPNTSNGPQDQAGYQHPYGGHQYQQYHQQMSPPPQAYASPFSGPSHPQHPQAQTPYGSQHHNQAPQNASPPQSQAYSPPFSEPSHTPHQHDHSPPNTRSIAFPPPTAGRCIHGETLGTW